MNILLLRPKPSKKTINLQSFMICEPLELEYCAAVLQKQGHQVSIVDFILEKKSLLSFLRKEKYDLVGMTGYICHVGIIKKYAAQIKAFDSSIITVVGGVHAEVVREDFHSPNIDHILGNCGLDEIVAIAGGKDFVPKSECVSMEFLYPYPDRKKTARYRPYYNYIFHSRCATLKTSFGCPYSCEFCFCTRISPYFVRDIEDVVEEIKTIEEDNIFIVDDNFLFDKERLERFCQLLEQNHIKKNYIAFGRADFIAQNEELIQKLKSYGFEAFFVGLESFRESELSDMNKRTTVEENIRAINVLSRCGIRCYAGIIAGLDWKKEDFDYLIEYINSFENMFVNIQPITPMPGTPLFDKLKDKIEVSRERYELWDMAHLVIPPQNMSRRRFYYHLIRAYLKTIVSKKARRYIKNEFGKKTYKRVKKGATKIFWQYFRLVLRGK